MTELEAVNMILGTIGEAGVTSLAADVNEVSDQGLARRTLNEVVTDVQSEGWSWNTDRNLEVQPAGLPAQTYTMSADTLSAKFSPNQYPDKQYVLRGLRIYDRNRQTFDIGANNNRAPIYACERISELPWAQMPHCAQQYITVRAARIFSDRYLASSVVFTYTVADEDQARTALMRQEEATLDNNFLWGNDRGMGQGLGYIPSMGTRYRTR